jgi:hypothetical protein
MPTESQFFDPSLRQLIRERIVNGQLPGIIPKQISGGYGSGKACAACDQPITSTQIEYEVEDEPNGRLLNFHFGCHVVWQLECAAAGDAGQS